MVVQSARSLSVFYATRKTSTASATFQNSPSCAPAGMPFLRSRARNRSPRESSISSIWPIMAPAPVLTRHRRELTRVRVGGVRVADNVVRGISFSCSNLAILVGRAHSQVRTDHRQSRVSNHGSGALCAASFSSAAISSSVKGLVSRAATLWSSCVRLEAPMMALVTVVVRRTQVNASCASVCPRSKREYRGWYTTSGTSPAANCSCATRVCSAV